MMGKFRIYLHILIAACGIFAIVYWAIDGLPSRDSWNWWAPLGWVGLAVIYEIGEFLRSRKGK